MTFPRLFLTFLIITCLMTQAVPGSASPSLIYDPGSSCAFGYAFESPAYRWDEIQPTGTQLNFPQADDGVVQVPLNFAFPYFEASYSTANVSSNGFISFGAQIDNAYSTNYAIPAEFPPNNIVAGFWDDLAVGGTYNDGAVYYQFIDDAIGRRTVFVWYHVTRLDATDELTFEIVIYENGDINFNYQSLGGDLVQATVGIEDMDGVDGCQLLYNSSGLASGLSYRLIYPAPGARVKAKPLYQGGFLANGLLDMPFTLINTGNGSDTFQFEISILEGSTDWQIEVLDAQKTAVSITPAIANGQAFPAYIRIKSAQVSTAGMYIKGRVRIISTTNPAKSFSFFFDAAIPAPFAAFYVDSSVGYIRYSMPQRQITTPIFPSFTGSTFAVARIGVQNYSLAWEYIRRGSSSDYENIQKNVMDPTMGMISPIENLADHTNDPTSTFDANPIIAVAPDGTIGMVFVRTLLNQSFNWNTNIYFARMNSFGYLLSPEINLTQDDTYSPDFLYNLPVITATTDNRFVIAYESITPLGGSSVAKDIDIAVVNSGGQVLSAPHHITDSQTSGTEFYAPTVTQMKNGNVFLAFLSHQSGMQLSQINHTMVTPLSGAVGTISSLNAYGVGPQAGTLSDGTIILAWIKDGFIRVGYTMFNPQAFKLNDPPLELSSANGWRIENISLTGEVNGNGVITWKDEWGYFLYYTLVSPTGGQVTPPMAFLRGSNPNTPNIISSSTGKGIAPLNNVIFWHAFLPAILR